MTGELDDIDLGILRHLQQDSSVTNKELGVKLNRSPSVIYDRIKNLEKKGYIKGYKAVIDYQKFNQHFSSYTIIQLKEHSSALLTEFEKEVSAYDEVLECTHITGSFDFLIKVVVANMKDYNEFIRLHLSNIPNVGKILTSTVIAEGKRESNYPI
jgi:Lrp/AsnC family leucine-responsive transcriptional regulator